MMHGRLTRSTLRRILFLLGGNVLLLAIIGVLLKEGSSFGDVLRRCGSDIAPIILAGLGMTAIIFTGAIDLSIASIIAVAGTVFGILVQRGASPVFCYAGCVLTAGAVHAERMGRAGLENPGHYHHAGRLAALPGHRFDGGGRLRPRIQRQYLGAR